MLHSVDWCLVTNGSVQHIGPILRIKQFLKNSAWPLKMGPIACPETLVGPKGEYSFLNLGDLDGVGDQSHAPAALLQERYSEPIE